MSQSIYRIIRLYRPVIGWSWWLQRGEWHASDGAMAIATGRERRSFRVDWEEPHPSKESAQTRMLRLSPEVPRG